MGYPAAGHLAKSGPKSPTGWNHSLAGSFSEMLFTKLPRLIYIYIYGRFFKMLLRQEPLGPRAVNIWAVMYFFLCHQYLSNILFGYIIPHCFLLILLIFIRWCYFTRLKWPATSSQTCPTPRILFSWLAKTSANCWWILTQSINLGLVTEYIYICI